MKQAAMALYVRSFLFLLLLLLLLCHGHVMPSRILLDTDVDSDDIFALFYLLKQHRVASLTVPAYLLYLTLPYLISSLIACLLVFSFSFSLISFVFYAYMYAMHNRSSFPILHCYSSQEFKSLFYS